MKTFLKKLEESIPEIIGGLTVEGTLILIGWLLKDNNNWLPLLVIVGGTFWIACGYIAFRYKTLRLRKRQNEKGKIHWKHSSERVWMYPRTRPFAMFGFIIFPLLILSWLSFDYYQQMKPPDKIVILVADFDGENSQAYRVTETILARLRTVLEPYDDVKVEALDKTITEKEGSVIARAEGVNQKAAIVIWGWYGVTQEAALVSVNFELLQEMGEMDYFMEEVGPEAKGAIQTHKVSDLESFTMQIRLSDEMAYLSLVTVGAISYATGDCNKAIVHFTNALNQNEEYISDTDRSIGYHFRGQCYMNTGRYSLALTDFTEALRLGPHTANKYNNLGVAYSYLENDERALANFNLAIEMDSTYNVAYFNRGNYFLGVGDIDKAVLDLRKFLELTDEYPQNPLEREAKSLAEKALQDLDNR